MSISKKNKPKNPTEPKQDTIYKKPSYNYAGKESTSQHLAKVIPKQFTPTSRISVILGLIFLATMILAVIEFPLDKLIAGDTSLVIKVGHPWTFLEFGMTSEEALPLKVKGLILDLILYLILAYAIDVIINLIISAKIITPKEDLKKQPTIFKKPKPTIAEKVVKKVIKEEPDSSNTV